MAKPRIFISSTFYDLRQIRSDLDLFVQTLGYDTILSEKGNIPYGKETKFEEYCYKEIFNVDILIAIIGGRFGHQSKDIQNSITQMEIKTAHNLNKQIYIFIEKKVYYEYNTYKLNKNNSDIKYTAVDDIRIYEFIDWLLSLQINNTIRDFEISVDITKFLKEQWAGLFHTFLEENSKKEEYNSVIKLESTISTLNQLVNLLISERKDNSNAIKDVLLSNNPAMYRIRKLLMIPHRVFFTNKNELIELLKSKFYIKITNTDRPGCDTYYRSEAKKKYTLFINNEIFDENSNLKPFNDNNWDNEFISLEVFDDLSDMQIA
jgi:hypothetical protein